MMLIWIPIMMLLGMPIIEGANILGMAAVPVRSHNILFQQLMVSLAEAGHNVTFYTHMPVPKPPENLTQIYLPYQPEQGFGQ